MKEPKTTQHPEDVLFRHVETVHNLGSVVAAMLEYSDQQNAELRERVKELGGICEYALKAIKEVYSPFGAAKPIIKRIEKTLKK